MSRTRGRRFCPKCHRLKIEELYPVRSLRTDDAHKPLAAFRCKNCGHAWEPQNPLKRAQTEPQDAEPA